MINHELQAFERCPLRFPIGTILDPYRWLNDPEAEETQVYVYEKQNEIFKPFLDSWEQPMQNQDVLYVQNSLEDEPKVFLDPTALSKDGTIALPKWIGLNQAEGEGRQHRRGLPGDAPTHQVTASWAKDNIGFFYARYPVVDGKVDGSETVANENQKLYFPRGGDSQGKDVLIVEFPEEPSWRSMPEVSKQVGIFRQHHSKVGLCEGVHQVRLHYQRGKHVLIQPCGHNGHI
ncbi:AAEL017348-PA [Aedes aegypti]|uniref:AAEL017348-PA n=1 Tax=Aedes aegypti TaxID=7159 RepID=J9HEZ3_AEDAE|nr:AAEL017348-PA [Aedes aegypti]